jgi:hypothetical protein
MACSRETDSGRYVKHQYVGDINDYRKYALLRALSAGSANRIGVCWMLTPDDGGTDGGKLAYLQQPEQHRRFDPELFDILRLAASKPEDRRLDSIEQSHVIPGAEYMSAPLFDGLAPRRAYMMNVSRAFKSAHLVFFDPDNGLETSLPMGRARSSKYLYLEEVAYIYEGRRSLLIYQHFPRVERATFMAQRTEQLRGIAPGCAVWAFTTSHVVFFLLVHPESPARLAIAALDACGRLDPSFVRGEYLGRRSK